MSVQSLPPSSYYDQHTTSDQRREEICESLQYAMAFDNRKQDGSYYRQERDMGTIQKKRLFCKVTRDMSVYPDYVVGIPDSYHSQQNHRKCIPFDISHAVIPI